MLSLNMKAGSEYEILIEQLYKKLDPESKIKRNDKIKGHNSGIEREIDVSIRRSIGPHEVLMIVQVKDHKAIIDVNVVGEFDSVIKDVKANKGILISRNGFTNAALTLANSCNIDALTGHDLANPKWAIDLKMPVILSVYEGNYKVDFVLEASQEYADMANSGRTPKVPHWSEWKVSDDGLNFKKINELFNDLCSQDILIYDGNEHGILFNGNDLKLYVMDGVLTPLRDFKFIFKINRKLYYKYFDVKEFKGFINRNTNKISRADVKVEGEEFTIENFTIINKKDIDLSTWLPYDESIELIHPYHIKCVALRIGFPIAPLKFEFGGNSYDKKDLPKKNK